MIKVLPVLKNYPLNKLSNWLGEVKKRRLEHFETKNQSGVCVCPSNLCVRERSVWECAMNRIECERAEAPPHPPTPGAHSLRSQSSRDRKSVV